MGTSWSGHQGPIPLWLWGTPRGISSGSSTWPCLGLMRSLRCSQDSGLGFKSQICHLLKAGTLVCHLSSPSLHYPT